MFRLHVLARVAALFAFACTSATTAVHDVAPGHPVQLSVGESAAVIPGNVRIRLAAVQDSRCPLDVVCVVAGDAVIVLTFSGAGPDRTDTLSLGRAPRAAAYGSYAFTILDVQPFPRSTTLGASQAVTVQVTPQ